MATSSNSNFWQLTLYEQHRKPHQVITDHTKLAISPRSLHNELMCPICLDILKNTMCTKECLHRFCQECIITALRSGNKECPTCRKKLVSKRSLRSDPNFDDLIGKIFPKRDEYDAHQEEMMRKLQDIRQMKSIGKLTTVPKAKRRKIEDSSKPTSEDNISSDSDNESSLKQPPKQQQQQQQQNTQTNDTPDKPKESKQKQPTTIKSPPKTTTTTTTTTITTPTTSTPLDPQLEIELIFKPKIISTNPEQSTSLNKERYIKTKAFATIDHLAKYLSDRIALESTKPPKNSANTTTNISPESNGKYCICIKSNRSSKEFISLEGKLNLSQIYTKYWHSKKPLELFYYRE